MKRDSLQISPDLPLPHSVVTATTIVYGGKGMGKSNFGTVLAEECSKAGLRWSVLDPMGVWWGIRHSRDGKGPGVECLILGGAHGDIPIEPTGGAVIADLIVDHDVSVIIDISRKANGEMWSIGERIRFATDYGRQLFKRQGSLVEGQRREPILQIIDEAARFIPQMIRSGDVDVAKCVGVWSAIVEEGRNFGIGIVLLTQRSARLNKDVAELADIMLAFRTVGPNSIEAVLDWLGKHVPKERIKTMVEQIRSLPVGSCLAVSPGWLGIEKVVAIRMRETFDSSATPKPGEQAARVKGEGAKPDLALYSERMKETIERAKADDPKTLRADLRTAQQRIRDLEKQQTVWKDEETEKMLREQLAAANENLQKAVQSANSEADRVEAVLKILRQAVDILAQPNERLAASLVKPIPVQRRAAPVVVPLARPTRPVVTPPTDGTAPTHAMLKILNSLAWFKAIGILDPHVVPMAFMAGYTVNGHFNNLRGALRSSGLIAYLDGQRTELTDEGAKYAVVPDIPPTDEGLQSAVLSRIAANEAKILRPLIKAWPNAVDSDSLAEAAGYTVNGHFNNMRGHLRSLGLIEYVSGKSKAADLLFPESV